MVRRLASAMEPGWRFLQVGVALVALTRCGGETLPPNTGDGSETVDPCAEAASLETAIVADFETVPLPSWFASNDGTPGVVIDPIVPESSELEAPKCATDAAPGSGFHVRASGFESWGYSFGFNTLNNIPGAGGSTYFDAEGWTGISIWVRKGSSDSNSSIFASVSDRYTDPSGEFLDLFPEDEEGALLQPNQCPMAAMGAACYCNFDAVDVDQVVGADGSTATDPLLSQCDRFGAGIGLGTEWRFFKVPFSRMRQRAYGRPSSHNGPDAAILGLDFALDGENWDFWIDDIAFYRESGDGAE